MRKLFLLLSLCCMSFVAWADEYTDANGVTWSYEYVSTTNSITIVGASGYTTDLVFPATLPYNNSNLPITRVSFRINENSILQHVDLSETQIVNIGGESYAEGSAGDFSLGWCYALQTVKLPRTLETIGRDAFNCCHALIEVNIPSGVTAIGDYAFANCYNSLTFIDLPSSLTAIGNYAFQYCYNLVEINLPSSLKTIGEYAFYGCSRLTVDNIPASVTSIGSQAFYASDESGIGSGKIYKLVGTNPPTRFADSFNQDAIFVVPTASLNTYQTANVWSNYASNILPINMAVMSVNVTAQPNGSGVLNAIGGAANQTKIVDLTVKGTINGYDFVMFKDKMVNLRYLDLSEADVVYNPYCYYEYNYSRNDTLGAYAFYEEDKLISIKLPKSVKHIGENAFGYCRSLKDIVWPEKLQSIGSSAFYYCQSLSELTFPHSLKHIGFRAFSDCNNLWRVTLSNKLESIENSAFAWTGIKEVDFPSSLRTISSEAFYCSKLEVVRIPSSLRYVGDRAFKECNNLKKVYAYTLEPTPINENTFSNFETAMLYVPTASGQNYYWDEGWKRFVNVDEFDGIFSYFYINNDLTLDATTGSVDGKPDAELYSGSGLIVESEVDLNIGNLEIYHDGSNGASIIAKNEEGNVKADSLHIHINVSGNRWYFFSFPFDLKMKNFGLGNANTQYVIRYYDGNERAQFGHGGWKNLPTTDGIYMEAGKGYIFQCNQSDVITLSLGEVTFKREDKQNELAEHVSANKQDASWNFTGNPFMSYYDLVSVGYNAPITVWDGYSYMAIRPGDDDYKFAPFEAFFVQKTNGTAYMEFYGEAQMTGKEAGKNSGSMMHAPARNRAVEVERSLVNITLSDGTLTDRTRVVFNEEATAGYEADCDAAKFSTAGVPQVYTIDSRAVKYAINERPVGEGVVTLGYTAPVQGNYVMEAPRMDVNVSLKDNATGTIHDFSDGAYEFASEAGTFDGRFIVMMKAETTSIEKFELHIEDAEWYNVKGQRVSEKSERGIYIKKNRKEVNL